MSHWLRPLALIGLLLACAAAWAQQLAAIPPIDAPVVDTTGTLTDAQKQELVQQALALQQRKGSQLQVVMVPTTQPEDIAQYTQRVFDQVKLGRKGIDDGVLVVVAKDDHRVRIEPGYGLEGAIPDAIANRIIQEYLVPKFRAGDYAGGLADGTAMLVRLIDGESLPAPMADNAQGDEGASWPFALFAAFIVAQIARGIFGRTPTPVRGLLGAAAAGGVAWLLSSLLLVGGIGAFIGLLLGLARPGRTRFAGPGGWGGGGPWIGGGGFGGGGFGGGGGGWGGGGGSSGGGGASGSW